MAKRDRVLGRAVRRLWSLLGGRAGEVGQALAALGVNSTTSFVAGAVLGSITGTFERYPGLLVMVPAAIGLRGNVFSTFGSRISTSLHTGTFELSLRRGSLLGQNVVAAAGLTMGMSVVLAAVAWLASVGLSVPGAIGFVDLALVSVAGGALASLVVLAATVGLAAGSVRFGWDLDNLVAPVVSTLGDVLTLPALFLATALLGRGSLTAVLGAIAAAVGVGALALTMASARPVLRQVTRESIPVLVAAVGLSTLAGIVIEKRLTELAVLPALLVLSPAFVSSAGSLGGTLSSRLSTKLHLGLVDPNPLPGRDVRGDIATVFALGLPVFLYNAAGANVTAGLMGAASPGLVKMVIVTLIAGVVTVAFTTAVAYTGTVVSVRAGLDPDTYGIPVVTSSVDFVGSLALVVTAVSLGVV